MCISFALAKTAFNSTSEAQVLPETRAHQSGAGRKPGTRAHSLLPPRHNLPQLPARLRTPTTLSPSTEEVVSTPPPPLPARHKPSCLLVTGGRRCLRLSDRETAPEAPALPRRTLGLPRLPAVIDKTPNGPSEANTAWDRLCPRVF